MLRNVSKNATTIPACTALMMPEAEGVFSKRAKVMFATINTKVHAAYATSASWRLRLLKLI